MVIQFPKGGRDGEKVEIPVALAQEALAVTKNERAKADLENALRLAKEGVCLVTTRTCEEV